MATYRLLLRLLTLWFWCVLVKGEAGSFVAYDCYGNVLSLTCKPGHRIKVVDDYFGVSPRIKDGENKCRYEKGDCTVTNGRFTSVIHRYCEGKQTCTNFQVDRRFCGTKQTNYEQVEYQCIPDADVTGFCDGVSYSVAEGYLSTPGFPGEYPPDQHCRCSLTSSTPGVRIRLEATHFIVKFDSPCKDWLEVAVGQHKRRLCGAYRSTLRSQAFNLTFHSDSKHGHQGIWLHFTLSPNNKNATVDVSCNSLDLTTTTTPAPTTTQLTTTTDDITTTNELSTTTTTVTTTITTTSTTPFFTEEPNSSAIETSTWSDRSKTTSFTDPYNYIQVKAETTTPPSTSDLRKPSRFSPDSSPPTGNPAHTVGSAVRPSERGSATGKTVQTSSTSITTHKQGVTFTTTATAGTRIKESPLQPVSPLESDTSVGDESEPFIIVEETSTFSISSTADTEHRADEPEPPEDRMSDLRKVAESKNAIRRKNNRITGIIIISICVGGIILLIVILSVLLCINKRRQPKRQAEKERKKRLQQRLNSLSFYDSIPLYDSIGRKTGTTVAGKAQSANSNPEIPPDNPPPHPHIAVKEPGKVKPHADIPEETEGHPQVLDPKALAQEWPPPPPVCDELHDREETTGGAATWCPSSGVDSDRESTIYSEIGKPQVGIPPALRHAQLPPPAAAAADTDSVPPPAGGGATSPPGGGDDGAAAPPVANHSTPPVPARTLPNGEGPPGYSLHLASVGSKEDIYTHV